MTNTDLPSCITARLEGFKLVFSCKYCDQTSKLDARIFKNPIFTIGKIKKHGLDLLEAHKECILKEQIAGSSSGPGQATSDKTEMPNVGSNPIPAIPLDYCQKCNHDWMEHYKRVKGETNESGYCHDVISGDEGTNSFCGCLNKKLMDGPK